MLVYNFFLSDLTPTSCIYIPEERVSAWFLVKKHFQTDEISVALKKRHHLVLNQLFMNRESVIDTRGEIAALSANSKAHWI